jgi:hypothetical protein
MHKFIKQHRNELAMGQASKNFLLWAGYMLGRVGLRVFGW